MKKLVGCERTRADERGLGCQFEKAGETPNVVVVPMRSDEQFDGVQIDAKGRQVRHRGWLSILADAGVYDEPLAVADMDNDALSLTWPKERDLNLVCIRWR